MELTVLGMHCNISLFKDSKNAFYDENSEYQLSDTARYAIGGMLKHIKKHNSNP